MTNVPADDVLRQYVAGDSRLSPAPERSRFHHEIICLVIKELIARPEAGMPLTEQVSTRTAIARAYADALYPEAR